jgi:hypothetical protein
MHSVTAESLAAWLNATTMSAGSGPSGQLPLLLVLPSGASWRDRQGLWPEPRSARCWSRWSWGIWAEFWIDSSLAALRTATAREIAAEALTQNSLDWLAGGRQP